MPTIVGILTYMSRKNIILGLSKNKAESLKKAEFLDIFKSINIRNLSMKYFFIISRLGNHKKVFAYKNKKQKKQQKKKQHELRKLLRSSLAHLMSLIAYSASLLSDWNYNMLQIGWWHYNLPLNTAILQNVSWDYKPLSFACYGACNMHISRAGNYRLLAAPWTPNVFADIVDRDS